MARQNPYQMDPFLAQGFSSLTKALIGDAETDYQVARTGYANAQTNEINELLPFKKDQYTADIGRLNATAGNQSAQAGNWNAKTAQVKALNEAATTLSSDPTFQGAAAAVLGLPDGATLTPEALQALALTAISGGNPDQRSSALSNIGASGQNIRAGELILSGTDDQAGRGALLLAPQGGEFQNPGFAQTKLADTLQNNLDVQGLENDGASAVAEVNKSADIEVANINRDSAITVGNNRDKMEDSWKRYAADKSAESALAVQESKNEQAQARLEAEIQWEKENDIIIEDGVMVFSPEAAERYNVTTTTQFGDDVLPTIDVRPGEGKLQVYIEGVADPIFLDPAVAKDFNIVNDGTRLVLPKGNVGSQTSGGSQNSRNTPATKNLTEEQYSDLANTIKQRLPAALSALPDNIQIGTEQYIIQQVDAAIGKNPNLAYMDAYNQIGGPIITSGVVELGNNNLAVSNIVVPRFFDNKWKQAAAQVGPGYTREQLVQAITNNATVLGYSQNEISKILESY
jgi:hypothetical protein